MGILVILVDLQCCRCDAKIRKVLGCLEEEYCIEKVEYDVKNNRVIVRGKFDPEKLCKKIWCKAGKIIKEILIVGVDLTVADEHARDLLGQSGGN